MRKSLTAYVLSFCLVSPGLASDVYRYRDNMPLAEMMLKMMDLFGIVDRIPDPYYGNQYGGYSGYNSNGYDDSRYRNANAEQIKFQRYLQMVQQLQNPGAGSMSNGLPGFGSMSPLNALGGMNSLSGMTNPLNFTGMGSNPLLGGMGTNPFSALSNASNMSNMGDMGKFGPLPGFNSMNPLSRYSGALPSPPKLMDSFATSLPNGGYAANPYAQGRSRGYPGGQGSYAGYPGNSYNPMDSTASTSRGNNASESTSDHGLDGRWRNSNKELLMISKGRFVWENPAKARKLMGFMRVDGNRITATVTKMKSPIRFSYVLQGDALTVIDPSNGQQYRFYRKAIQ